MLMGRLLCKFVLLFSEKALKFVPVPLEVNNLGVKSNIPERSRGTTRNPEVGMTSVARKEVEMSRAADYSIRVILNILLANKINSGLMALQIISCWGSHRG